MKAAPKLKAYVESLPDPAARAAGAEPASPFEGTWKANLAKSKRHPAHQFRSATMRFEVAGDAVTFAHVLVGAIGREERGSDWILADGIERPSRPGNGYSLIARWRGSHVLETGAKKDGQIVGRGTYEVSADGQTLTLSADEQVIVLDRCPVSYP